MRFDWNQPPGASASRSIPRSVRTILASFLVGVISVGVAWAGAGLAPVNDLVNDDPLAGATTNAQQQAPSIDRGFTEAVTFATSRPLASTVTLWFGGERPATNKNHYLRWENDVDVWEWCVKHGIRLDQSKGASKSGEAGFDGWIHRYIVPAGACSVITASCTTRWAGRNLQFPRLKTTWTRAKCSLICCRQPQTLTT